MIVARVLAFLFGFALVAWTLRSAVRTFVLPRSATDLLVRSTFRIIRRLFNLRISRLSSYEAIDGLMAIYAPVSLLMLPVLWLILVQIGYTAMYWALGIFDLERAFVVSGSSLLTLGFATVDTFEETILAFSEASIGLFLVALLITYLPTIYGAFSRRENAVTLLEVRAGGPPSAVELIARFHRLGRLDRLGELWATWEVWFADVEETHTSLAALVFFRSPQPDHSWITAAGTVLDGAALTLAAIDTPRDIQADLTIRAGYLCLRRIAAYFDIPFNENPTAADPISISRAEFDAALRELAEAGVPLRPDREQAWRDFVGWRVNYDVVLLALAVLTLAPIAPWVSDRAPRDLRVPLLNLASVGRDRFSSDLE